jgi:hypothetical protein
MILRSVAQPRLTLSRCAGGGVTQPGETAARNRKRSQAGGTDDAAQFARQMAGLHISVSVRHTATVSGLALNLRLQTPRVAPPRFRATAPYGYVVQGSRPGTPASGRRRIRITHAQQADPLAARESLSRVCPGVLRALQLFSDLRS